MAETWVWRRIQKSGEAWSRLLEYEDRSTSDARALLCPRTSGPNRAPCITSVKGPGPGPWMGVQGGGDGKVKK